MNEGEWHLLSQEEIQFLEQHRKGGANAKPSEGWVNLAEEKFQELRERRRGKTNTQKMINTIVALVDANMAGQSETAVFNRPDTCHVQTYHQKWKHDQDFAECLESVGRLAQQWKDSRAVRSLESSAERLALSSPVAVAELAKLLKDSDPRVRLRAAVSILDRAGVETAVKQGGEVDRILRQIDLSTFSDEQLERLIAGEHPLKVLLGIDDA